VKVPRPASPGADGAVGLACWPVTGIALSMTELSLLISSIRPDTRAGNGHNSMLAARRPKIDGADTRTRDRASRTSDSGGRTVDRLLARGEHRYR
jgi:hypothetical protein